LRGWEGKVGRRVWRVDFREVRVWGVGVVRRLRVARERAEAEEVVEVVLGSRSESFWRRAGVSLMGGTALLARHHAVSATRECRM
jgi:hypothetical protein